MNRRFTIYDYRFTIFDFRFEIGGRERDTENVENADDADREARGLGKGKGMEGNHKNEKRVD